MYEKEKHRQPTPLSAQGKGNAGGSRVLLLGALLVAVAGSAAAAPPRGVPSGQPFQALQGQIDVLERKVRMLSSQVVELTLGNFRTLRVNDDPNPSELLFGPDDLCRIGIDPTKDGREGLIVWDPNGMRVLNAVEGGPNQVFFGEGPGCSIGTFGAMPAVADAVADADERQAPPGLFLRDPDGIRILNPDPEGAPTLLFGESEQCRLRTAEPGNEREQGFGLIIEDPQGVNILNPIAEGPAKLSFGPTGECNIRTAALGENGFGMIFEDPRGFLFDSPLADQIVVEVNGKLVAQEVVTPSSLAMKQNVEPIRDALERLTGLQGVYFDWKPEHGGRADVGFIAEEVATVLPEVVLTAEDGASVRGVKYSNIMAVAVEGIKAQQGQIDALRQENAELRRSLAALQEQVGRLAVERKPL